VTTGKDDLYETTITEPGDFVFDERVVNVFPDMINRSVPGYGLIVPMIAMLARRYAQAGTRLYDLGCSLGAVTLAMRAAVRVPDAHLVAVDASPGMIEGLQHRLQRSAEPEAPLVETRLEDLLDTAIEQASVVVLNFTLQFIHPQRRGELMHRIARGLVPGGILVLSEKVCFEDAGEQRALNEWHHEFKRGQGYSDLEIARKRDALENVMIPESVSEHRIRLAEAGFVHTVQWFQGFNFVSMVAFR